MLSAVETKTEDLQPRSAIGSVEFSGVSKRFRKQTASRRAYTTVKSSILSRLFGRTRQAEHELMALRDVSFQIKPGTSLGIIGRNGSGKSTLLKLLSGIYQPTSGSVRVNGRVSALIELGAGFHPDFSGRENIYLGGTMYGLTRREIDERFDDIVRYAELEEFIDDPVRTYSSGMYMRLGFSVAIFTDPDILLVDEVLAVGDASFVHRCFDSVSDLKRRGKTLILVTHDLSSVLRWCDEAIWLEKGVIKRRGAPQWVVDEYMGDVHREEERALEEANRARSESVEIGNAIDIESDSESANEASQVNGPVHGEPSRWGSRDVEITEVRMLSNSGESKWIFDEGEGATIEVSYEIHRPVSDLVFGIGILRADGVVVHGTNTMIEDISVPVPERTTDQYSSPLKGTYRFQIERLEMLEHSYFVDVAAHAADGSPYDYHHMLHKFSVRAETKVHGICNPKHSWSFKPEYVAVSKSSKQSSRAQLEQRVSNR